MRRTMYIFNRVVLLGMVVALLASCGGTRPPKSTSTMERNTKVVKKMAIDAPESFRLRIKIADYKIKEDFRILDYQESWGRFIFVSKARQMDVLVFKLKSDRHTDYYWLTKIPPVAQGEFTTTAVRYRESSSVPLRSTPPDTFAVSVNIVSGKVAWHTIADPCLGCGKFAFDRFQEGIVFFRNRQFPMAAWAAKMPIEDGRWTIFPLLQ